MLLRLLQGLDKERFDITLATQQEDELCRRVSDLDIDIEIIPFKGVLDTYDGTLLEMPVHRQSMAGLRLLQFNLEFHRRIETPDVLWCGGTRPFITLLPYARLTDATTIWNVGLMHESTGKVKSINSVCLWGADHVFIESKEQAKRQLTDEQYANHFDKFTVFYKGLDTEKFDPSRFDEKACDKLHVGTAALINPRKGLEHFIDAAAMILEQRDDVYFTIAGAPARENDKQYKKELEARVRELTIENHIEFLGWVEEMPEYLSSLDVFVLPSYNEGIPGAVREALAMSLPVIATDIGGTSEVVHDGETGILIEPEDPDAIAEAVDYLLSNPEIRAKMGARGRDLIVSEFSSESYVANYEAFLKRIATN